jgi:hypothetical protein
VIVRRRKGTDPAAMRGGKLGGIKGGKARANKLSASERRRNSTPLRTNRRKRGTISMVDAALS